MNVMQLMTMVGVDLLNFFFAGQQPKLVQSTRYGTIVSLCIHAFASSSHSFSLSLARSTSGSFSLNVEYGQP